MLLLPTVDLEEVLDLYLGESVLEVVDMRLLSARELVLAVKLLL